MVAWQLDAQLDTVYSVSFALLNKRKKSVGSEKCNYSGAFMLERLEESLYVASCQQEIEKIDFSYEKLKISIFEGKCLNNTLHLVWAKFQSILQYLNRQVRKSLIVLNNAHVQKDIWDLHVK